MLPPPRLVVPAVVAFVALVDPPAVDRLSDCAVGRGNVADCVFDIDGVVCLLVGRD